MYSKGPFTRNVNVTVFVSGTFELFNIVCKTVPYNSIERIL